MSVQLSTFGAFTLDLVRWLLRWSAACAVGGGLVCWVAAHAHLGEGSVFVHVLTNDVDVIVDGRTLHVDNCWESPPLALTLREGQHRLRMVRDEAVLYDESFSVRGGDEVVLVACVRNQSEPGEDQAAVPLHN